MIRSRIQGLKRHRIRNTDLCTERSKLNAKIPCSQCCLSGSRIRIHLGKFRDGIFKLLRSPGIDSKELIPPAYVARLAGTTTPFVEKKHKDSFSPKYRT